jgi:hypothetical protein
VLLLRGPSALQFIGREFLVLEYDLLSLQLIVKDQLREQGAQRKWDGDSLVGMTHYQLTRLEEGLRLKPKLIVDLH